MKRTIKVDEEVHKQLTVIKAEKGYKSINALIRNMLKLK